MFFTTFQKYTTLSNQRLREIEYFNCGFFFIIIEEKMCQRN